MATYWLKCVFVLPLFSGAPAPYVPSGFRGEINQEETRVMGLLCGCMILT